MEMSVFCDVTPWSLVINYRILEQPSAPILYLENGGSWFLRVVITVLSKCL